MDYSAISSYFDDTVIDVLRSDGKWQRNKFKGQIKLADDFISIFNRPTRRRMLILSPENHKKLNGTVVRIPEAEEIFLVGNPQKDLAVGGAYRVTLPLNKITSTVEIYRKTITGVGADVGSLESILVGEYYMDLELRTLTEDGETLNSAISKYFFWFPSDAPILAGDEFTYNEEPFTILEAFNDTGFRGVRATNETDSRETLVYNQLAGEPIYDNITGEDTTPYTPFEISAEVKEVTNSRSSSGQVFEDKIYTVLIEANHIGVVPTTKDNITIDEANRDVKEIVRDRHSKSWELTCQ